MPQPRTASVNREPPPPPTAQKSTPAAFVPTLVPLPLHHRGGVLLPLLLALGAPHPQAITLLLSVKEVQTLVPQIASICPNSVLRVLVWGRHHLYFTDQETERRGKSGPLPQGTQQNQDPNPGAMSVLVIPFLVDLHLIIF